MLSLNASIFHFLVWNSWVASCTFVINKCLCKIILTEPVLVHTMSTICCTMSIDICCVRLLHWYHTSWLYVTNYFGYRLACKYLMCKQSSVVTGCGCYYEFFVRCVIELCSGNCCVCILHYLVETLETVVHHATAHCETARWAGVVTKYILWTWCYLWPRLCFSYSWQHASCEAL